MATTLKVVAASGIVDDGTASFKRLTETKAAVDGIKAGRSKGNEAERTATRNLWLAMGGVFADHPAYTADMMLSYLHDGTVPTTGRKQRRNEMNNLATVARSAGMARLESVYKSDMPKAKFLKALVVLKDDKKASDETIAAKVKERAPSTKTEGDICAAIVSAGEELFRRLKAGEGTAFVEFQTPLVAFKQKFVMLRAANKLRTAAELDAEEAGKGKSGGSDWETIPAIESAPSSVGTITPRRRRAAAA